MAVSCGSLIDIPLGKCKAVWQRSHWPLSMPVLTSHEGPLTCLSCYCLPFAFFGLYVSCRLHIRPFSWLLLKTHLLSLFTIGSVFLGPLGAALMGQWALTLNNGWLSTLCSEADQGTLIELSQLSGFSSITIILKFDICCYLSFPESGIQCHLSFSTKLLLHFTFMG